jgi:hypothetical protein
MSAINLYLYPISLTPICYVLHHSNGGVFFFFCADAGKCTVAKKTIIIIDFRLSALNNYISTEILRVLEPETDTGDINNESEL